MKQILKLNVLQVNIKSKTVHNSLFSIGFALTNQKLVKGIFYSVLSLITLCFVNNNGR